MNDWLPKRNPKAGSLPLLCFPFAGGGTAVYHQWRISSKIEVLPVRLPGRESRFNEAPVEDFDELIGDLLSGLEEVWSGRCAMFGHSMGATIAYELACRATAAGHPPEALFVAACGAPLPRNRGSGTPIYELPNEAMIDALIERYHMQISADERALMLVLAETIRADLKLFDSYKSKSNKRLPCPVFACGGADDPRVSRADLEKWKSITDGRFSTRVFAGGHFFIRTHFKPLSTYVEKCLLQLQS